MPISWIHTIWTPQNITELSGSNISEGLNTLYSITSGWWDTTAANSQYVWSPVPQTAAPVLYTAHKDSNPVLTGTWETSSANLTTYTSATCGAGYIYKVDANSLRYNTYIAQDYAIEWKLSGEVTDIGKIGVEASSGTGADPTFTGITPYSPEMISSAVDTLVGSGALSSDILTVDAITGAGGVEGGWLTRFFNPYLGIKQGMRIQNEALYCSAGYASTFPYPPCGTTSSIFPLSSLSSVYEDSYNDAAEYMYGWTTVVSALSSISANMISSNLVNVLYVDTASDMLTAASGVCSASTTNRAFNSGNNAHIEKILYTAPDSNVDVRSWRTERSIASLRLQWDREFVKLPISAVSAVSGDIWNEPAKNVLLYLLKNYTPYDVIREVISGQY